MIKWYDKLYMDNFTKKNQKKIVKLIEKGKLSFGVYVIMLASNSNNLFDIMNANELLFNHYKKNEIYIVGMAFSRESAMELVQVMIEEVYHNTGDIDVKNYMKFN